MHFTKPILQKLNLILCRVRIVKMSEKQLQRIDYFYMGQITENVFVNVFRQTQEKISLTAQNGPRLNFHIGNVSQDTSVL